MKHLIQLTFTSLAALSLTACGSGEMNHSKMDDAKMDHSKICLLYTSPSPRDATLSRMPSSA